MTTLLANILGASLAVIFVGYFALSVGKPALIIIVVACLSLMAIAVYQDIRDSRNGS